MQLEEARRGGYTLPSMKYTTPAVLLLSLFIAGFSSCSVATSIQLDDPVSGSVDTRVTMDPLLRQYLGDLAEIQGTRVDDDASFFDTAALTAGFSAAEGISLTGIVLEAPETLRILAQFPDIQRIFPEDISTRGNSVFHFQRSGNTGTLSIRVDARNVASILEMVPFGSDPVSQTITGVFQSGGDEEELKEMLVWTFEEYASAETIEKMIDSAAILLRIQVPGRIQNVDGGIRLSENTAEFSIPLLRFMSLNPPLEYAVRYSL
jgi:hypothetical protein